MSNNCLMIMHARDVRPAQLAFGELDIAKIWMSGYTEAELAESVFMYAISNSDYDNYMVVSDDAIVRPQALEAVVAALDGGCDVATGYSQRSHTDFTVNVTDGPLRDSRPTVDAYTFRQLKDVVSWPEHLVPTWFAGMSVTGMSRDMWIKYPFGCFTEGQPSGYASDFHLARRLQDDRVPIYAVREAFCYHWRTDWERVGPDDDPVMVGVMPKQVVQVQRSGAVVA